jgi:hypothetical protein
MLMILAKWGISVIINFEKLKKNKLHINNLKINNFVLLC